MSAQRRAYRFLDAAMCRGAFGPEGSLTGLSPHALAYHMAVEWSAADCKGASPFTTAELVRHAEGWLKLNREFIGKPKGA